MVGYEVKYKVNMKYKKFVKNLLGDGPTLVPAILLKTRKNWGAKTQPKNRPISSFVGYLLIR